MSFVVVIPARYASTRLPGKPLLEIAGKPMLQWVYERAADCLAEEVVIATDDERIRDAVLAFGGVDRKGAGVAATQAPQGPVIWSNVQAKVLAT